MGICASKPTEESATQKKSASERKETYADAAKHGLEQDTATEGVKVAASDAAKVAASDVSKLAEAAKA